MKLARFSVAAGLAGAVALATGIALSSAPSAAAIRPVIVNSIEHSLGGFVIRPDACGKPVTYPIKDKGGSLKLPSCGGTSGNITYPSNNAPGSATVTLTAYTTNPAPSQCGTVSGETTLAYITATSTGSGSVLYNDTAKKSALHNPRFPTNATFTLYAFAFGSPLFSEKLGRPNAQHTLKFASPLNDMNVPLGIPLCFELDTP